MHNSQRYLIVLGRKWLKCMVSIQTNSSSMNSVLTTIIIIVKFLKRHTRSYRGANVEMLPGLSDGHCSVNDVVVRAVCRQIWLSTEVIIHESLPINVLFVVCVTRSGQPRLAHRPALLTRHSQSAAHDKIDRNSYEIVRRIARTSRVIWTVLVERAPVWSVSRCYCGCFQLRMQISLARITDSRLSKPNWEWSTLGLGITPNHWKRTYKQHGFFWWTQPGLSE